MASTAWALWNKAKKNIGNGVILLGTNAFRMQLHTSAAVGFTTAATLSINTSVTGECTNANGYVTGGQLLTGVVWTTGQSVGQYKFDIADPVWTATGGTIPNIKYAMIRNSTGAGAGKLLCWSKLTTAQFTLAINNTLTIQINSLGVFTLS